MPDYQVPPHIVAITDRLRAHRSMGPREAVDVNVILAYDFLVAFADMMYADPDGCPEVSAFLDQRIKPEHRDIYLATYVMLLANVCQLSDCAMDTLNDIALQAAENAGVSREWRQVHDGS